ncbi:chromosomal replication initiator protein DnaA [Candidatus Woesebacteria bacterium RBG_16_34_12]|uniref:Chromosomal replication initiator protein DnaA n=1 Tax=Candidatus Woesebacteria bacterium RBG_16_34_12 TaxID=1802480 RepID=A0A1F7X6U5_9BACT|nr:MAG: chromosomal replication initiator protein DnaA [Candidatus Woesebacteria bacterium RBG_16_34_12]
MTVNEHKTINKNQVWNDCLESIKVSVSSAIFNTWFSQTHLVNLEKINQRFLAEIGCHSTFVKNTIEKRYFGLLQDSLIKTLDCECDLIFVVKQITKKSQEEAIQPLFNINQNKERESNLIYVKTKVRTRFTFENFAVSSSNQMAWAAAEAVSKDPGSAYNPLIIWGGVGVGKTHLMNAVGYYLLQENENAKVLFCTGEDFTNGIVEGIRKKTTPEFRAKYRKLTALLIDDIQFIAGKDAVQEEFFHTFNSLASAGGQIILTSDKPPSEISKLEDRLKSRFEAGLIVDIAPPDFELRCAIVQIKAKERQLEIPMDLVQLIAGNIDHARQIEGFLVRLSSEVKLKNSVIDSQLIENLIGKGTSDNSQSIKANPTDIISAVSKYFSVGKRDLLGASRSKPIAEPRQILMYLLRTQLALPLQEVGRIVGGRDHTTVIYAVDKITHIASIDVQIRTDLQGIKNLL